MIWKWFLVWCFISSSLKCSVYWFLNSCIHNNGLIFLLKNPDLCCFVVATTFYLNSELVTEQFPVMPILCGQLKYLFNGILIVIWWKSALAEANIKLDFITGMMLGHYVILLKFVAGIFGLKLFIFTLVNIIPAWKNSSFRKWTWCIFSCLWVITLRFYHVFAAA